MNERLSPTPEFPFWKGADIATTQNVIVPKLGYSAVGMNIPHGGLPSFLRQHSELASKIRASTRSRWAQLGLEIEDNGTQLQEALTSSSSGLENPNGLNISVQVNNHSQRDILIPLGAKVFRSFYETEKHRYVGNDLLNLMESRKVAIEGNPGETWEIAYDSKKKPVGMYVKILEDRRWIPPDKSRSPKPMQISDKGDKYRDEIDQKLVSVPQTPQVKLWIGETVRMTLAHEINGILHSAVSPNLQGRGSLNSFGTHVNSHLIDGGETDWGVRVEVNSSTVPAQMPNFAYFYFVKAA